MAGELRSQMKDYLETYIIAEAENLGSDNIQRGESEMTALKLWNERRRARGMMQSLHGEERY